MTRAEANAHRLKVTEPLELRFLPDDGLHFEEALEEAWIEAQLAEDRQHSGLLYERSGPTTVTLDIDPLGSVITRPPVALRGHLRAPLRTHCVRCQDELDATVDTPIESTLFPSKDGPTPDTTPEHALDESSYVGDVIDLPGVIREALLLGLSMHPTCADEPTCDARTAALLAEVNAPAEALAPTGPDPRWEALRHLVVTPDNEE